MAKECLHKFENSWKIDVESLPNDFTVSTPNFSPLPNKDGSMVFKISRIECEAFRSVFRLELLRNPDYNYFSTLEMNVHVTVLSKAFSLVQSKESVIGNFIQSSIRVNTMFQERVCFKDFCWNDPDKDLFLVDLTIKCTMEFYDYRLSNPKPTTKKALKMSPPRTTNKQADYKKHSSKPAPSTSNKQASHLPGNMMLIYKTGELSDIVFNVGTKSFRGHKIVLAAQSPVLMKMFSQLSQTNCVIIPYTTPEIFDLFLKYLYSGEVEDNSWPSIKELLYLADKYQVKTLKEECIDIAISLLSVDLICEILKLSFVYNDLKLKSAAKDFAVRHMNILISRGDWKELIATDPMIGYEVLSSNIVPK